MSFCIYCLYSNENGVPRYVGCADDKVSYLFKRHVTAALDKEPGVLYDWMREVWRQGHDVAAFTLQEDVRAEDQAMFEQYWVEQFADLINAAGNQPRKEDSAVARQVIAALKQLIGFAGSREERQED
jgi:hypothetical protein